MGVNSLPKTVTRQRRGCDLNPGPSAPESSTLTSMLPSYPGLRLSNVNYTRRLLGEQRHSVKALKASSDNVQQANSK